MKYAQLGTTDLVVSRVCFGCWQLSPAFWGEVEIGPWREAVRAAIEVGVNFIDTADAYGDGLAEKMLGEFLEAEGLRDKFVIATKFYHNFEKEQRHPDTRYEYIMRACEASLKRLRTDRIDLYQVHAFDPLTRPGEVAEAIYRLRREGKIRHFGVSNLNPGQMSMYARYLPLASLQPPYSMIARKVEENELPFCLAGNIGVIPYSPLYRGLLTGKYSREHAFEDSRANNPLFRGHAFRIMLDALDRLRPLAEKHGLDLACFAIRWLLTHPAVTAPIVGVKRPEHITGIAPAVEDTLPVEDWHLAGNIMAAARREAESAG